MDKCYGPFDGTDSFKVDDRIELHPATDLWMRGSRYGTVTGIVRHRYLRVTLDTGGSVTVSPDNVGALL